MRIATVRVVLVAIFFSCWIAQAMLYLLLAVNHDLGWLELRGLEIQLFTVYSIPLALILSDTFADRRTSRRAEPLTAWVAVVTSTFWNLISVIPFVAYFSAHEATPDGVKASLNFAGYSSSLVVGALTYFLTNTRSKTKRSVAEN